MQVISSALCFPFPCKTKIETQSHSFQELTFPTLNPTQNPELPILAGSEAAIVTSSRIAAGNGYRSPIGPQTLPPLLSKKHF